MGKTSSEVLYLEMTFRWYCKLCRLAFSFRLRFVLAMGMTGKRVRCFPLNSLFETVPRG